MDMKCFTERYSCRHYDSNRSVPAEIIADINTAAIAAPSHMGMFPLRVHVFTNEKLLAEAGNSISSATGKIAPGTIGIAAKNGASNPLFYGAPCAYVITSKSNPNPKSEPKIDAVIMAENICTAATMHKLGSVIIGLVNMVSEEYQTKFKEILGIPQEETIQYAVAVGYRHENSNERKPNRPDMIIMH